jgi:hypothetical protein
MLTQISKVIPERPPSIRGLHAAPLSACWFLFSQWDDIPPLVDGDPRAVFTPHTRTEMLNSGDRGQILGRRFMTTMLDFTHLPSPSSVLLYAHPGLIRETLKTCSHPEYRVGRCLIYSEFCWSFYCDWFHALYLLNLIPS